MSVYFYTRGFFPLPPDPLQDLVRVEQYSWSVFGGPDTMSLSAPVTVDKWSALNLLRCPVEVYNEDGVPVWWGYVSKISVPEGQVKISVDIEQMYNNVAVIYTTAPTTDSSSKQGITAWNSNAISVGEFGTKERIETLNDATATTAPYLRDKILNLYRYPVQNVEYGASQKVEISCKGWWSTLDWTYYTSTDTTAIDTLTQIGNMLTAEGQFFTGVTLEGTSGLTSSAYRDPFDKQKTARAEIESLLAVGNNGLQRYTATVTKQRRILVTAEPLQNIQYLMDEKGNLETLNGSPVSPSRCLVGVWVAIKNIPATDFGTGKIRPVFIERAEYSASGNKMTPQFAGTRDTLKITAIG